MSIYYGSAFADYLKNKEENEALLEAKKNKIREESKKVLGYELGNTTIGNLAKCGKNWKRKLVGYTEFGKKYPTLLRVFHVTVKKKNGDFRTLLATYTTFEEAYNEAMEYIDGCMVDFHGQEARVFVETNLDEIDDKNQYQTTKIKVMSYLNLSKYTMYVDIEEIEIHPSLFTVNCFSKSIGLDDTKEGYTIHEF